MANHQKPGLLAKPQDDKALFLLGVFWVVDHQGFLVIENRPGFLEGNLVFALIDFVLVFVPFKLYPIDSYIISIL